MSKPLMLSLAIGLALSTVGPAGAQARSHEADSLLREVRVLDSVMLARGRTVDSVRRSIVRPIPPVDIQRGPLHVRTDSAFERSVRGAVDSVSALIDRRGGTLFAARTALHVPTVTRDSTRSIIGMLPVIAINADTSRRWSQFGERQVRGRSSVAEIADGLAAIVEQFAMQGADSTLAAWVMLGRAPLRPATTTALADAYIELSTTESVALRRCRSNELASCLDALGVDSMPGTRLARWYTPDEYRSVMRVVRPASDDSAAVAAWIRCRTNGAEGACRSAAEAVPNDRVPLPLSASVRFTFLREVLDAGGPGAFDRLLAAQGNLRDRFSAAANEPIEKTTARWLSRIERSRPDRMHVSGTLLVASLGWTSAILGFALVRRTSWA